MIPPKHTKNMEYAPTVNTGRSNALQVIKGAQKLNLADDLMIDALQSCRLVWKRVHSFLMALKSLKGFNQLHRLIKRHLRFEIKLLLSANRPRAIRQAQSSDNDVCSNR